MADAAVGSGRFALVMEDELALLLSNRLSNQTKNVIKTSTKVLNDYAMTKNRSLSELEDLSKEDLARFLRTFYAEVRKISGELYAKKYMITLRYGIQKHFERTIGIDIVIDPAFKEANEVFQAMMVKLKCEGKGVVKHKDPITPDDLTKLYASFDRNTPEGLQAKVFVNIMLHLCNRGRENLREFDKNYFGIEQDSTGLKYVFFKGDLKTKNHQGRPT